MPEPDTENKDWPEVELYRSARFEKSALHVVPDHAGLFRRSETYLPLQVIRERLLSDEAVEAAWGAMEEDSPYVDSDKTLSYAREVLGAAVAAAFPQEEAS